MAPELRKDSRDNKTTVTDPQKNLKKQDQDVLVFLNSPEFSEIIAKIVRRETSALHAKVDALTEAVEVLKIENEKLTQHIVMEMEKNAIPAIKPGIIPTKKPATAADERNQAKHPAQKERKREVVTGTAIPDERKNVEFAAIARRIWVHVGRVQPGTKSDSIKQYLKRKCPHNEFTVEAVNEDPDKNTSFKVGCDLNLKDKIYSADFWPAEVAIQRFRFFRNRKQDPTGKEHSMVQRAPINAKV